MDSQRFMGSKLLSPVNATIHERRYAWYLLAVKVAPHGGLLVIDSKNGQKLTRFPWRSSSYESANAVPPIPISKNRIFLSECYEKGGVMLSLDSNFSAKIEWHKPKYNIHWMTPITIDNHMYGIAGRHQRGAEVFCTRVDNGEESWRKRLIWQSQFMDREINLELFRGSLLGLGRLFHRIIRVRFPDTFENESRRLKILIPSSYFCTLTWTLPAL